MRWPWKRQENVVASFGISAAGEVVELTIATIYEQSETVIASHTFRLSADIAENLHRDLSAAAERARTYPERQRQERLTDYLDALFRTFVALDRKRKP